MRVGHVPDAELTPGDVPSVDDGWSAVATFGRSFHAYKVAGSIGRIAELTLELHDRWTREGVVDAPLGQLRIALFHTVRAVDADGAPDADTMAWSSALLGAILAELTRAPTDPAR